MNSTAIYVSATNPRADGRSVLVVGCSARGDSLPPWTLRPAVGQPGTLRDELAKIGIGTRKA